MPKTAPAVRGEVPMPPATNATRRSTRRHPPSRPAQHRHSRGRRRPVHGCRHRSQPTSIRWPWPHRPAPRRPPRRRRRVGIRKPRPRCSRQGRRRRPRPLRSRDSRTAARLDVVSFTSTRGICGFVASGLLIGMAASRQRPRERSLKWGYLGQERRRWQRCCAPWQHRPLHSTILESEAGWPTPPAGCNIEAFPFLALP